MSEIRGLSVTQPHASLIALGAKRIETRSWLASYRGLLAVHASRAFPRWAKELCLTEPFYDILRRANGGAPADVLCLPLGTIIATARLAWCFKFTRSLTYASPDRVWRVHLQEPELSFGDFSVGRFGFLLADVRPLPTPIACRGKLGLWVVDSAIVAQIRSQGVGI